MKWQILLILCVLFSLSYASATDITLDIGESYTKGNVNITLARIDGDYEKVVLCVNNERQIVYEDQFTYFKDASLEVEHIDFKDKNVDIDIDWINSCEYCKCEGDCLNDKCNVQIYDEYGNRIKTEENTETDTTEDNTEINTEELVVDLETPNYFLIISLIIIGSLIGIILVWLFWFREMSF